MTAGKTFRLDEICEVEYGTRVVQKRDGGSIFPVYGGGGATFQMDEFNREDRLVISRFGMSEECARFVRGKFFLNDSGLTVSPKNGKLLPSFLDYQLYSKRDVIYGLGKGSAQKNLDVSAFRLLPIFVPDDLQSQRRIVSILDEAFDGIATAKANAEKNFKNARELFLNFIQSVFQNGDASWKVKALGDIAQIKGGKRVPKGYKLLTQPTDFPYLRVTEFSDDGTIDTSDLRYIDAGVRKEIKNYVIYSSDLYVSIAGTIGKTGVIPKELDGANLTENACRLVFNEGINNKFVYFFTVTPDFVEQAGLNTRTAAQPKLALSRLATIRLGVPSLSDQERLVRIFEKIKDETRHLESIYQRKLAAMDELKQSLLHQAFSGAL